MPARFLDEQDVKKHDVEDLRDKERGNYEKEIIQEEEGRIGQTEPKEESAKQLKHTSRLLYGRKRRRNLLRWWKTWKTKFLGWAR